MTYTSRHITDVEEGLAALHEVFGETVLAAGTATLDMQISAVTLPLVSLGYLDLGADIQLRGVGEASLYHVATLRAGRLVNTLDDGTEHLNEANSAALWTPGMGAVATMSDYSGVSVAVTEPVLRHQLEAMLDRSINARIVFEPYLRDRTWTELVGVLANAALTPDSGLLSHPMVTDNLQQLLIEALLLAAPHNYSDALTQDARTSSAVVKRAIEAMHDAPQTPWSTVSLARESAVSRRSLQKAFAAEGYPPPMAYLRQLKLRRVHDELLRSEPGSITVTAVARRWGFIHGGRFASQYRELFGQNPSQTLQTPLAPTAGRRGTRRTSEL
jgi:AraC-like DNA-binding protein